ncbi:unnamed protein product [Oncorhynchus mykiss]|uniref:Uncharacterized protein n=1 Tax=Oncorhynchus mykiss TaxID=8022 RepID=A0A060Z9I0_ONCMY|nr:unnamed protein product [Oncorhynchus mykiss]
MKRRDKKRGRNGLDRSEESQLVNDDFCNSLFSLSPPLGSHQDLSHVMSGPGLVSSGAQEITLTINNSSLTQALAQAQANAAAGGNTAAGNHPQEITLTISGQDLLQQHGAPGGGEMIGGIRLASHQTTGATLTMCNDHLLPQSNAGLTGKDWQQHGCVCVYVCLRLLTHCAAHWEHTVKGL